MSNFPEIVNGKFGGDFGEELLSLYRINPLFWGLGSFIPWRIIWVGVEIQINSRIFGKLSESPFSFTHIRSSGTMI